MANIDIKPTVSIADGDKGDITVSGVGTIFTIDSNVITNTKLSQLPTNTIKANATGATANPQDFVVNANSSVGRVDELNGGNLTNIPFIRTLIGQVALISGSATVFDTRITTNSIAFYTPTSTGTLSSVPLRVSVIAGQATFSNGQVGDNATINFQIYF